MSDLSPAARLRALPGKLGILRQLSRLSADELTALTRLARNAAQEHVEPLASPTVSPQAIISPLASLRFAERVDVGPRASIGPFCVIWGGWSRTWARVGRDALLSPGVVLVAGNHRIDAPGAVRDTGFDERDVEVGEGAWVGAHAVIIGCRVGAGAVIGAGAVVTEDVPENAIAVGVPARVIGTRPSPDQGS